MNRLLGLPTEVVDRVAEFLILDGRELLAYGPRFRPIAVKALSENGTSLLKHHHIIRTGNVHHSRYIRLTLAGVGYVRSHEYVYHMKIKAERGYPITCQLITDILGLGCFSLRATKQQSRRKLFLLYTGTSDASQLWSYDVYYAQLSNYAELSFEDTKRRWGSFAIRYVTGTAVEMLMPILAEWFLPHYTCTRGVIAGATKINLFQKYIFLTTHFTRKPWPQ